MKSEIVPIKEGIVIDHVPKNRGSFVYAIIFPYIEKGVPVNIKSNIPSYKIEEKWVFKIEELIEDEDFFKRIAIAGGEEITINLIKNEKVIEKYHPSIPETLEGFLCCPNPNCVGYQDMHAKQRQVFYLLKRDPLIYKCGYCGRKIDRKEIDGQIKKAFK